MKKGDSQDWLIWFEIKKKAERNIIFNNIKKYSNMKPNDNKQIKKDIYKLKRERTDFRNKSLSKNQIIRRVGINHGQEILSHIRPTEIYGEERYLIVDIKRYLNKIRE